MDCEKEQRKEKETLRIEQKIRERAEGKQSVGVGSKVLPRRMGRQAGRQAEENSLPAFSDQQTCPKAYSPGQVDGPAHKISGP